MALSILAPMAGWVTPLDEVPDPVFADRILGDGVALDPTSDTLLAPCDGVIIALAPHAVTIRAECGAEILIHVGLETVALKGEGFTALAGEGLAIKAGDPILSFDLEVLARHAKSLITPIIIANGEGFAIVGRNLAREVATGAVLMEIVPVAASAATVAPNAETAQRSVVVASEHGLHARPAALLASAAKTFSGEVTLRCGERSANAKSTVAIMALGVRCGEAVVLSAAGEGAEAIVARLAERLEQAHHEAKPLTAIPSPPKTNSATRLHGVCAAPGRVAGVAVPLRAAAFAVVEAGAGIAFEQTALRAALAALRTRLEHAAASASGPAHDILMAHLELLADTELEALALHTIAQNKSAAFAWRGAMQHFAAVFRRLDDPRLRERAADLIDLERQVLSLLLGTETAPIAALPSSAILIAEEILPSDLSGLDTHAIAGLLSAQGGPTSHVAILAASMGIPALVGVGEGVLAIPEGADIVLDADGGFVDLAPDRAMLAAAKTASAEAAARSAQELAQAGAPCFTADGVRIEVFANLAKGAEEAKSAVGLGAEGCGLLRTEFLFMERATPPSETEQRAAYQAVADALGGRPFILRTFDIGADKPVAYLQFPHEDNPQLGLRGIRAGLAWPDLLRTQLRAVLQVTPVGRCKILLPMITALGEFRIVQAIVADLCAELAVSRPDLGVMIETPASALLADQLIEEADFLSIGTNDLTQYALAIDRTHGQLSKQLDALHPAVLRLIARTADAANAVGKIAAVCGGLAADPLAAPILIGLGIKELSLPAPAIPRLKAQIRGLRSEPCRALARAALACESAAEVRALSTSFPGDVP
jgi:phosphocarrier protein FPr/phosphocarrier protein